MSNNGNERIARSIHLFLCDHVKWEKVLERVQTIKKQLKRALEPVPSDDTCSASEVCCAMCSNKDECTMIVDEQQGFKICLGSDGQGCGGREHVERLDLPAFRDGRCTYTRTVLAPILSG